MIYYRKTLSSSGPKLTAVHTKYSGLEASELERVKELERQLSESVKRRAQFEFK